MVLIFEEINPIKYIENNCKTPKEVLNILNDNLYITIDSENDIKEIINSKYIKNILKEIGDLNIDDFRYLLYDLSCLMSDLFIKNNSNNELYEILKTETSRFVDNNYNQNLYIMFLESKTPTLKIFLSNPNIKNNINILDAYIRNKEYISYYIECLKALNEDKETYNKVMEYFIECLYDTNISNSKFNTFKYRLILFKDPNLMPISRHLEYNELINSLANFINMYSNKKREYPLKDYLDKMLNESRYHNILEEVIKRIDIKKLNYNTKKELFNIILCKERVD